MKHMKILILSGILFGLFVAVKLPNIAMLILMLIWIYNLSWGKNDFIGTALYDYKNKFIIREKIFKLRIL